MIGSASATMFGRSGTSKGTPGSRTMSAMGLASCGGIVSKITPSFRVSVAWRTEPFRVST